AATGTAASHLTRALPTYPFQRQRYWLSEPPAAVVDRAADPLDTVGAEFWDTVREADAPTLAATLGLSDPTDQMALASVLPALTSWWENRVTASTADSWRHRIAWRPVADAPSTRPGDWLVVLPAEHRDDPRTSTIRDALAGAGAEVRLLSVDASTQDRTSLAGELRRLLDDPAAPTTEGGTKPVTGVLSLLALDERPHPDASATPVGTVATIALLQALEEIDLDVPLWVCTTGAVSTAAADVVTRPGDALLWGLAAVAAVEHPTRWGGIVDLPEQLDPRAAELTATALRGATGETELAVRPAGLLARRLVPAPRSPRRRGPAEGSDATRPTPSAGWEPRGTVLITGGTGALGGHVARWLARSGAPHLLLTSRRGERAPGAAELAAELRGLGTRVTIAAVDVADKAALADVLAAIPAQVPLHAVVHTAAVLDDGLIAELTPEKIDRVLRVKVGGARNLHELTLDADLDAFVLFSSIAGTAGVSGQGNYAPGNAYLDALAAHRRAAGFVATSLAWGQWAGEGLADGAAQRVLARYGLLAMAPDTAVRALADALADGETSLAVVNADWRTFHQARPHPLIHELPAVAAERAARAGRTGADGDAAASGPDLAAQLAELAGPARRDALLAIVRAHVAAVQGVAVAEQVDVERGFRDQGFDSLAAVNLRNRLIAATRLTLPVSLVFDYPTVAALTDHLLAELVPAEPTGLSAVLTEIDRLEAALGAVEVTGPDHAAATGRLRDLLDRFSPPAEVADRVATELSDASDAELIDFIGNTLGIS
ncbi:SDR family NAD(P)-dependent oxidoreductase, partial [Frankia sp. AgKG'84/4]